MSALVGQAAPPDFRGFANPEVIVSDNLDPSGSFRSRTRSLPDLVCTCRVTGHRSVWVHVTGRLDRDTASLLEQTLRRAELRLGKVVLDLRELAFIDRAGVQVIVEASIAAWLANRRLLVVRGRSQIDRVFARADVSDVVEIGDLHPSEPPDRLPAIVRSR
jgi:anti-anti-sigma factor